MSDILGAKSWIGKAEDALRAALVLLAVPPGPPPPPPVPGAAGGPGPTNGATAVATTVALSWAALDAATYDVKFGTSNPPSLVSADQVASVYVPATLTNSTTYYWQIIAKNATGSTTGPVWSFTTTATPAPAPTTPATPAPANGATGVGLLPTLTWTAPGATTYDMKFGTVNPPPTVATGLTSAAYSPASLAYSTTYFWRIVATNVNGSTTGPVWVFTTPAPPPGNTVLVPQGGDLQAAINAAQPGDTITLARGATYSGSYTLPVKSGASMITIRTVGDTSLPALGSRIDPSNASLLAKVQSPTSDPAFRTLPGAHHWQLMLLELGANSGGYSEIVRLGDGGDIQTTLAAIPYSIVLDRLYIHGDPVTGQKRGVAMNSASTSIIGCYISDIKGVGQDTQAIQCANGPGPFIITNNYLEAAAENVLFGGADAASVAFIPSDITFTGNTCFKPAAWLSDNWSVKNIFELKCARRVYIGGNIFDTVWADAQVGYALTLTVRNQDGAAPFSTVEDVVVEANLFRHMGGGVQILGRDDAQTSVIMHNVVIRGNTFEDINPGVWGGTGRQIFIAGGPVDLSIVNNIFGGTGLNTALSFDDPTHPSVRLVVTGNYFQEGDYGIIGSGGSPGIGSLEMYATGYTWSNNTMVRTVTDNSITYPAGTTIVAPTAAQFIDDFNRTGPGAGSNWGATEGTAWVIASATVLKPVSGYANTGMKVVGTFPNDQYAEVETEIATHAGDYTLGGPAVRMGATGDCYHLIVDTTNVSLYKYISGVDTYITEWTHTFTLATLYLVRLAIAGTTATVTVAGTPLSPTATVTGITSGSPGLHATTGDVGTTNSRFDNFKSTAHL